MRASARIWLPDRTLSSVRSRFLSGIAICLASMYFLVWEIVHRGVYQYAKGIYHIDDADEWRYTACSRLVEHGHALFTEVFSAQPPLLFESLAVGMRFAGDSIAGARIAEISFGLLGLVCAAWASWLLFGPPGGALTAWVLAVSPAFLVYSHTVEAEGPMMALTTLAMALALVYWRRPHTVVAFLAGLALSAAILTKLFAFEAVAPGLWIIVMGRGFSRRGAVDGIGFLLATTLPTLIDAVFLSPSQQWDQVVAMHEHIAQLQLPNLTSPGRILLDFLTFDLGLSVLAFAGLVLLAMSRRRMELVFLTLWTIGTALMLWLFHPLFPHHPAILLCSLGVAAGAATLPVLPGASDRSRLAVATGILAALAYFLLLPRLAHAERHVLVSGQRPIVLHLGHYVATHTLSTSLIAVDDLAVADVAHRLVVPPLCDPSNVRLHAGYLTAAVLIQSTRQFGPTIVLPSFGIFHQVPAYLVWLQRHFQARPAPDSQTAYFRR